VTRTTTTTRLIAEQLPNLNSRKRTRIALKPKAGPGKKSLAFFFEEINALKVQLQSKPEKTACSKNRTRKAESILSPLY
jgi:hypothetical protein